MRNKAATCLIFLILAAFFIAPTSGLRVDGAILKADVIPGEHIVHEITVKLSENEQAINAEANLMGFGSNIYGEIDAVSAENDKSPYSARGFFRVSPNSFYLEPGVPVKVTLDGDIPEDVGSGGRYAIVEIRTAPQGNGTVGISTAILVPIYLTINGTSLIKTGKITGIDVSKDGILSMLFENTGNCDYGVYADVLIKDKSNHIIGNLTSKKGTSLPAVPYPFTIKLNPNGNLTSGKYTIEANVILNKDETVLDNAEATFNA